MGLGKMEGREEGQEGGRNGKGQEQFLGLNSGDWMDDNAINQLREPWRRGRFKNADNEFEFELGP